MLRSLRLLAAAALLTPFGATLASAASPGLAEDARVFLLEQVLPGGNEVEIVVGEPDPRLVLAPCGRFEPFIPPGARLWGRSSLGVRCIEGANWTIYVPVEVRVFGAVQVAARPIARGRPIGAEDVRIDRIDLTRINGAVYAADESLEGTVATRQISAGEPLRRDLLRPPPILAAGDPVKVIIDGAGFAVSVDGKALAAAGLGQAVRVATAAGRVVTGIAHAGHLVVVK